MKKMHTIVAHNRPFLFIVLPTISKPIQITFSVPKKCLLAPLLYNDFATTATIKITSTTSTTVPTTTTMVGFIYTFSKLLEIMACRLDLELEMWRYSGIAKSSCITQPHLWGRKSDIFLPEVIAQIWLDPLSLCFASPNLGARLEVFVSSRSVKMREFSLYTFWGNCVYF